MAACVHSEQESINLKSCLDVKPVSTIQGGFYVQNGLACATVDEFRKCGFPQFILRVRFKLTSRHVEQTPYPKGI